MPDDLTKLVAVLREHANDFYADEDASLSFVGTMQRAADAIERLTKAPDDVAERLREIEARANAAAPLPWHVGDERLPVLTSMGETPHRHIAMLESVRYDGWKGNADFLLHSRADIPWLLSTIRTLLATQSAAVAKAREEEREACAKAVERRAVELDKKECCGRGHSNHPEEPPECCGDPDYMISNVEAAAAIRARSTEKE